MTVDAEVTPSGRARDRTRRARWLRRELIVAALLIAISRNPELVVTLALVAFPEMRRTWTRPLGRALARDRSLS